MKQKKIFIIGAVREATPEWQENLNAYVAELERNGNIVHLPQRDTNQKESSINICIANGTAIAGSDEVHLFYSDTSQGTHFDLGMAFAMNKKLVIVENGDIKPGKSFPRMCQEWATVTANK